MSFGRPVFVGRGWSIASHLGNLMMICWRTDLRFGVLALSARNYVMIVVALCSGTSEFASQKEEHSTYIVFC